MDEKFAVSKTSQNAIFRDCEKKLGFLALFRPISLDESNILNYKYRAIVFYLGTITTLMGLPMSSFEEIKEYTMAFFWIFHYGFHGYQCCIITLRDSKSLLFDG